LGTHNVVSVLQNCALVHCASVVHGVAGPAPQSLVVTSQTLDVQTAVPTAVVQVPASGGV
jgi:hypothetical protein